jgi:hypothetical protein
MLFYKIQSNELLVELLLKPRKHLLVSSSRWRGASCSAISLYCIAIVAAGLLLMPPLRSHFFVGARVREATGTEMTLQKIHHILFATVPNAWCYRDGGSGKAPAESGRSTLHQQSRKRPSVSGRLSSPYL